MRRLVSLLAISFLIAPLYLLEGATFYVSTAGNDANPGSKEKPWKKPGFASKKLKAGDTLLIKPGTYLMTEFGEDMITLEASGNPQAWITIRGDGSPKPLIKGGKNLLAAVDISGHQYVRIENLEFSGDLDSPYSGGMREGIDAGGSAEPGKGDVSHVVIADVVIHHVEETGINLGGSTKDTLIQNVHIHHTGGNAIGAPAGADGKGLERVKLSRCLLEFCGLFSLGKEQKSAWDRPDGFGIEESDGPIEIDHCISRLNFGDGFDSKSRKTWIHHCQAINNFGDGVKLWGTDCIVENTLIFGTGFPQPMEGSFWQLVTIDTRDQNARFSLTNVTMADDPRRPNRHYPLTIQYDNRDIPATLNMTNCIVQGYSSLFLGRNVTLKAENTLFFNTKEGEDTVVEKDEAPFCTTKNLSQLGSGNLYGDPRFVNPVWGEKGDFRLQDGSPAIDRGKATQGTPTDLEDRPRPQGKAFDMGAFER